MNRRIMAISLLLIVAILMSGCVEKTVVVSYNATRSIGDNITTTEITEESTCFSSDLIITGKVVEIAFINGESDVIVFEDNYVINAKSAERFAWEIGTVHRIIIIRDFLNQVGTITSVEIENH